MGVSNRPGQVRREGPPATSLTAPLEVRLFNYEINDATLKQEHRDWLTANLVPILRACPHTKLDLPGTASRTGTDQYNLKLSEQRAKNIDAFLQQNGIVREQIAFRGLGEAPARAAGKRDETESDEDRAVLVEVNPPA